MLILIIILILIAFKPWRFFSFSLSLLSFASRSRTIKVDDVERPLVSDDVNLARDQSNDLTRNYDLEGACYQNEDLLRPPRNEGLVHKQRIPPASSHLAQGDSLVLDVISDPSEDISVGQTLKRPSSTEHLVEALKLGRPENQSQNTVQEFVPQTISDQQVQEVASLLRLSLVLLVDGEVSGKHAQITWNSNKLKWELVDMGSLNGTLLNSRSINHPDSGSRQWGHPMELSSGDIITLGTTSNIHVHISSQNECLVPFGVGMISDPMSLRRGGKKLPMEDVCYYQWPLPGIDKFGMFGICDGHGGVEAARAASKRKRRRAQCLLKGMCLGAHLVLYYASACGGVFLFAPPWALGLAPKFFKTKVIIVKGPGRHSPLKGVLRGAFDDQQNK
ncbi:hypothetical protein V6N12_005728 [Hibiscus sabdariffa]|uniref:FHA domain-containing protein n=1 Tax=Hibiscus sabdariffa TaxID=183260 RepID=A0ABR1Z6E5_9ROSI